MSQRNELRLDRVVSSQPELGPSIPDGGYGWIIVIACLVIQVIIPSIICSYGIFILYIHLEESTNLEELKLWDISLLPTTVLFVAFGILTDPWSRSIVTESTWPRLVGLSGIFLVCAGLVMQWAAMKYAFGIIVYICAGALSGFGSSLTLIQSEVLISQYFRLKLLAVNNILICANALGFIIIPMALGNILLHRGIFSGLWIYHSIVLHCLIYIFTFKKPLYLKAERRRYELLEVKKTVSEDDEMIFATDPRESNISNQQTIINQTNNLVHSNQLTESFNSESQHTSHNIQHNNEPSPIYTDVEMISNTTFSFGNANDDNIRNLPAHSDRSVVFKEEISFLFKASFYKSIIFLSTIKYSQLIFWMLFPTYLYVHFKDLKVQQATFVVGAMGLGNLFIALFTSIIPFIGNYKQIATSSFCLIGSVGYFILSDAGSDGWLLFAALLITMSITALNTLTPTLTKYMLQDCSEKARTLLYTLSGLSILLILVYDLTYQTCFRIMSLLQFLSGFLFLLNIIFIYVKKLIQS